MWKTILKRISAKRIFGPSREFQRFPFIAAHLLDMKVFEFQHGITYAESLTYSGYRDNMVVPDIFLAFGDNKPRNVYGIDENKIIVIGWAFQSYVRSLNQSDNYKEKDVLVISDPEITDSIIDVVLKYADQNPDSVFYFRPHPQEYLSKQQLSLLSTRKNVKVQDKSINIFVTLQLFTHIVGENSTALYEALSLGKKVGKLFGQGLHPIYLIEEDKDCFWEISSQEDFRKFLSDDFTCKKSKSIYSPFDKELFVNLLSK